MRAWDDDGVVHAVDWADADAGPRTRRRGGHLRRRRRRPVGDRALGRQSAHAGGDARRRAAATCIARASPSRTTRRRSSRRIEVDPTGAGDVFAGAFLWHLYKSGGDWQTAADWANCVASFVVEKRGVAGVPKLAEVEKRWRSNSRITARVGA